MKKRLKHGSTLVLSTTVILLALLMSPKAALANQQCEGVAFMPTNLVLTRAQDQTGFRSEYDEDENIGYVDVHTYNHFYTFQVDRDVNERNEGLVMDLVFDHEKASSPEGFAFRLRAEFNSAEASRSGMGFSVNLGYKKYDNTGYTIETIAEMNSLNTEEGEGTVSIDIPSLPPGRAYQLRYLFGEKEVLRSTDSLSMEEDSTSTGDSVVSCNLPFFTQELVLIDRKVLKNRVRKYNQSPVADEHDITKTPICDFSIVDGETMEGEFGLQCNSKTFTYPITGKKAALHQVDHGTDEQGFKLRTIATYPFRVSGKDGEPITQLFKMTVGMEFAFGAGFRAILRRTEGGVLTEYETLHPFECLLDQSCQFAWRQQKNHQSFQVVLTTGDYELQLFDLSSEEYTDWLVEDLQLSQVPFTVYLESYPILQNEVRDHCPFMFLLDDFIQQKYIDGRSGQKFHYNDKVIMNLYDLKQEVIIVPELDSHLKVVIREAFGVNAMIGLCHTDTEGTGSHDCFQWGEQIGTTEILYSKELKQDQEYTIVIDYSHSILAFHKFDVCPHLPVEISLISDSEAEMINKNMYEEVLGKTDKKSRANLKDIFARMSSAQKVLIDDPVTEGAFLLTSKSESKFEVLSSNDFRVDLKMGIFMEIFYSPFEDEVLELYLGERYGLLHGHQVQADTGSEYDNSDKENLKAFELNKYKSSKTIWVDLEPGEYTLQILMKRQPGKVSESYYEKVNFQLYIKYDFVNVPREAFLPGHLNYHGLLGSGDETHDFGHVTLLWDDMTLWHHSISTLFQVESEMASVAIQIEQTTDMIKMHLSTYDQHTDKWTLVGVQYPMLSEAGRIDTLELFEIVPNQVYKIELYKDAFTEHASIDDVEMGERYGIQFSIKIDFSEFDEDHLAANLQKQFREFLPHSMDQVAKVKMSLLGLNEKSFMMGNRNLIHLIEYGDGWQDMTIIPSYVPKERRVFISKQTEESIIVSLPFEVKDAEMLYAGVYEYTQGVNLLSVHIIDDETHEEVSISRQGKHLSLIQGLFLPAGNYYFVVKNDRAVGMAKHKEAPLEFVLDIVRHQLPEKHEDFLMHQLESIQLCQLPQSPTMGLSKPGYMHSLSGGQMQTIMKIGLLELDSGSNVSLTLTEDSFVTVYVETAEDIPVALHIKETGGVRGATALSSDQDSTESNFLKQEGFKERNVVQIRQFLAKGVYWIGAKAMNEDVLLNFDERQSFCETFTLMVTVNPIKTATKIFNPNTVENFCEQQDPLVNQLKKDGMVRGNLVKELSKFSGAEVGYIDFESSNDEGPFLIYFQLDYDLTQEGVVAVVLSQYDRDYSSFTEIGLYSISDSQTTVLQIVERGTYVISIQSIVSTSAKFGQLGISKQQMTHTPLLSTNCFRGVYTYMAASINEHDSVSSIGFNNMSKANRVRVMETVDDLRNLREFETCHHSEMPQHFPISDEGFERQYAFRISSAAQQEIDLIIEEPSLVRVKLNMRNPMNQIHAMLLTPDAEENQQPVDNSDSVHNMFMTTVEPSRHPYVLQLIHTEYDPNDPCPVYDFHIAVKPLRYIVDENLECRGHDLPPTQITVEDKITKLDVTCSFSDDLIEENVSEKGKFKYDMYIDLPHSDYFFDVQMKNDFLTGNFRMKLYTYELDSETWVKIAESHWFDEFSYEDLTVDSDMAMSTKIGDKTMIQKLRYIENIDPDLLENSSQLMLRIVVETNEIIQALKSYELYNPHSESLCFNFDLSFFADEIDSHHTGDNEDNKLIRVDWTGKEQSSGKFDTSGRVTAFLEFEKSLSHHMPQLKQTFQQSIYLQPLTPSGEDDTSGKHVVATQFKSKSNQDDTLVLGFKPYSLEKGMCYKLKFLPPSQYMRNNDGINIAAMVHPQIQDSFDLHVCASACECDVIGTAECVEDGNDHVCLCHPLFHGEFCDQCESGYYRNADGYCETGSVCADLGGEEYCNNHGTCYQEGPAAICDCDPGFANVGLDQCARCSDPMMRYPTECSARRNWVLQQEDYECESLMHIMPRKLFKDPHAKSHGGLEHESQVVYQYENGILEWTGRYTLIEPNFSKKLAKMFYEQDNAADNESHLKKESLHKFFVQNTSMFRIHLNTLDSNVKARWAILDEDLEVVTHQVEYLDTVTGFGMLTFSGLPSEAIEKPFTLLIEYEHEHQMRVDPNVPACPKIELHFVVEPAHFHTESIECSPDQLQHVKNQELAREYTFDSQNNMNELELVIPSFWLKDGDKHRESFLQKSDSDRESKMAEIKIDITLHNPGVFTSIVATDFSDLNVYINFVNKATNELLAIDKSYMLDDIENNGDHYGKTSDVSMARNHKVWDHLSAIEFPHLDKGTYEMQISIPKAHWFLQKSMPTCLKFDLIFEFVQRDGYDGDDAFTASGPVEIISVYPPGRNDLDLIDSLKMQAHLSHVVDFHEAAQNLPDMAHLCQLQNQANKKKTLNPDRYFYDKDKIQLTFNFHEHSDMIIQVHEDNKNSQKSACWQLHCKDNGKNGELFFKPGATLDNSYCFDNLSKDHLKSEEKNQCNPFSKSRGKAKDGSCMCTPPYTGKLCEQCESGFQAIKQDAQMSVKQLEQHTVCVPNEFSDELECNGFGKFDKRRQVCECENYYAGHYCEMCEDPDFEYPDCTGEMEASFMESLSFDAFNSRRREQVYHEEYHLEAGTPFQQQCQYTDYPNFLNQMQNHKQFITGDFHIADIFTVNHDADNVIEFTPRLQGLFKIMLKQPELEAATAADESMHLEIGIVRADGTGHMNAETNHYMNFMQHTGIQGALTDFGVLELEVPKDLVDEPLLIYFRGVNQTHDSGSMEPQLCTQLFIEIEFRAMQSLKKCDSTLPELTTQRNPIVLGQNQLHPEKEQIQTLTILEDSEEPFFYQQDFYIKNDDSMAQFEIEIQLAQKFIDQHLIIPIVEILQFDIEMEDFDSKSHKAGAAPQCDLECLVAGHKLYNAFTVLTTVPRGTMLRIWLYQNVHMNPVKLLGKKNAETCVNYALSVRTVSQLSSEHEEALKEHLYCEHTRYLPRNLNRLRYLGVEDDSLPQQDFDYMEHFRVDNLKHEGRETKFSLKERTVVRMDGVEHEDLSFFFKIYKGKQVVAGQEGHLLVGTEAVLVPSIFTVLEPGEYKLQISFIAREAEILRQPCQSIQVQIAMNRADQDYLYPREQPRDVDVVPITLENITSKTEQFFEARVLPFNEENGKFQTLFDDVVVFEDRDDLNMIMKVSSDFLRADVNFMVTHLDTDHHFMPQHIFEDAKKMALPELIPGAYRFVIFMQNVEVSRNTIFQPVLFSVNFRFFSFEERTETYMYPIIDFGSETKDVELGEQIHLQMPYSSEEKFECMLQGRRLPDNLTQGVLLHETDFSFTFTIYGADMAFINDHQIKYQPEQGEDIIRIQVDEGVQVKLYLESDFKRDQDTAQPLAISHDKLGNNMHELVASDLSSSKTYIINVIYASSEYDFEQKSEMECLVAVMQVKIASSKSEYRCLTKGLDALKTKLDKQADILKLSYKNLPDKGKHLSMVASKKNKRSSGQLKAAEYQIEIVDHYTNLEITIEGSDHLYGSLIQIIPVTHDDSKSDSSDSDRGMSGLLGKVFGDRHALEPSHITSPKHMTKYRFTNVSAQKYSVRLLQPAKPADCDNVVDVLFQVTQSLESRVRESFATGRSTGYQSKIEVEQHGVFKLPTILPVQLDSYRFLGGGSTEERYVLLSDTYSLGDDESQNVFKIGARKTNDTYVKLFVEDDHLSLNLTCIDTKTKKQTQQKIAYNAYIEDYLPMGNECTIALYHKSKEAHAQRLYLQEKVRITVMVASHEYVLSKYLNFHKEGLASCPTNQWPLALAKNMELTVDSDEQSYYNYPLIRYPLGTSVHDMYNPRTMNTYYFRFNETQRFYFEVGSNFVVNHAVLKLQPTQKSFGHHEIVGKQIGNINVIDSDVPPGDYELVIQTYKNSDVQCGLYSLRGILNMHSAMAQHLPGNHLVSRSSMCEIRNSEEAPTQIFANSEKTRKGNEAVIDPHGNFFRFYSDLLIVKQHAEVLEPWKHEIVVDLPNESFIQVIMSSEYAEDMFIRIVAKNTGKELTPSLVTLSDTNTDSQERKAIWKLDSGKPYMITLEYGGDMYNRYGEEERCAYFDLVIAIDSIKSLAQKLSCNAQPVIAESQSLLKALPREISDHDLDFHLDGLYTLKYPQDFKQIQFKSNGKDSMALMLPTILDMTNQFSFSASIAFDVNMADFLLQLVAIDTEASNSKVDADGLPNYEVIERSSHLINLESNDDETFLRHIEEVVIDPSEEDFMESIQYLLTIEETQAHLVFNEVAKSIGVQNLCLPFIFKLDVEQHKDSQHGLAHMIKQEEHAAGGLPAIVDFIWIQEESEYDHLIVPFHVNRLTAEVLMTSLPKSFHASHTKAFMMAFKVDGKVIQRFAPVDVNFDEIEIGGDLYPKADVDFKIDLSGLRKRINGAIHLELQLEFDNTEFAVSDQIIEKSHEDSFTVEFPTDVTAKHEAKAKAKGSEIRNTLLSAIETMQQLKDHGKEYPQDVVDLLRAAQDADFDSMHPNDISALASTIESIATIVDMDHHQTLKADSQEEIYDFRPKKSQQCNCVHGTCREGESSCAKCDAGWHGRLCDIDDDLKNKKKAKTSKGGAKHIDEDDEDNSIFHPKKIRDQTEYEPPVGRRSKGAKKDKTNEYVPKQSYSHGDSHSIAEMDDVYDLDGGSTTSSSQKSSSTTGHNRKSSSADADKSDSYSSKSNSKTSSNSNSQSKSTQSSVTPAPTNQGGFLNGIFWSFIWCVEWIVYIAIIVVCLVLLKAGCDTVREKLEVAQQKKRKGRKKRQNEEDDGMGLAEDQGVTFSDDEEEGDGSPIEMTLVNRAEGKGSGKKRRPRQDSDSLSESTEERDLKLFDDNDADEENRAAQPQDPANAGSVAYNPFDEADSQPPIQQDLLQYEDVAAGQDVLNEIDDALDSDGEDDEFGTFV